MSTYPIKHLVVSMGYRLGSDGKRQYHYRVCNSDWSLTERTFVFTKRVRNVDGIGVAFLLTESKENTFHLGSAEYVTSMVKSLRASVSQWRAEEEAASNALEMKRKFAGEDEWEDSLAGIRVAYHHANRTGRAAIIGKLIMYLES